MSDKSILDTVADEANKLFEHAAEQIKAGKLSAARETFTIAESMSYHAKEIEDHDDRMGRNTDPSEVTNISISGIDVAKTIRADNQRT